MLPPPSTLGPFVQYAIPTCKLVLLGIAMQKYQSSKHQPFTRNVYQHAAMGAAVKILALQGNHLGLHFSQEMVNTLQDLSFCFPLFGVVLTTGLDFLWALSSTMETNALFNRNISETDFVSKLQKVQLVCIPATALVRYLPTPWHPDLVFNWIINIVLMSSFGFVWYCLWKVHGSSTSDRFQKAYRNSVIVNLLCSMLVANNVANIFPVMTDVDKYLSIFNNLTHILENIGISLIFSYFAYIKAPPAHLKDDRVTSMYAVGGIMKAKAAFKRSVNQKKE